MNPIELLYRPGVAVEWVEGKLKLCIRKGALTNATQPDLGQGMSNLRRTTPPGPPKGKFICGASVDAHEDADVDARCNIAALWAGPVTPTLSLDKVYPDYHNATKHSALRRK